MSSEFQKILFKPHPLIFGPHAQTLAGFFFPGPKREYRAQRHDVPVSEGDCVLLHDDCPSQWQPGDRVSLLVHGLGGCHGSPYVARAANNFYDRGIRSFRMDMRGAGASMPLVKLPYHAGRSEDLAEAITAIEELCPGSPVTLIAFSLGANIALKLAGELGETRLGGFDSLMAVSPPVDLGKGSARLSSTLGGFYDRYFARYLSGLVQTHEKLVPDAPRASWPRRPRTLREFDSWYTVPRAGYTCVDDYYDRVSSRHFLPKIRVPTLILSSRDDPLTAPEALDHARYSSSTQVLLTDQGGHLGFLGRPNGDPDMRWMDWRVVDWVTSQNGGRAFRAAEAVIEEN